MASELVSLFGGVHDQIVSSHPRSRSPPRLPFLSPPPILETPGEFTPRRNATAPMTLKQYLKEKPGPQSETTPRQSVCSSTSPRSGAVTTSGGNMRSSPETSHAHSDGLSRFKQIVLAQQHSVKGARAATADACVQLLRAIKTLPKEGNSVPKLVQELRRVLQVLLDGLEELHEMTLNAHQHHLVSSFSTPGQTQTTLGLVLLNNLVDNLLPGGPAHLAGIRKGDAILEVS